MITKKMCILIIRYLTLAYMQNEAQHKKYTDTYNQLNAAQKDAVDTIEGPVMVIAGPGTGKTQILGCRIGKILLDTDTRPENILCLTFTDAGVVAMRKRLLSFIGTDSYKVNVCTYHAFCNDIIQQNLSYFEYSELEPISDLESLAIFKELIHNYPKGHALKRYRGDVYYDIKDLAYLYATIKKEGIQPHEIIGKIQHYIHTGLNDITDNTYYYQKNGKAKDYTYSKGDPKATRQTEIDRCHKLIAALQEYTNYTALMQQYKRYDYNDMINWVIQAFTHNPSLLAQYQEQYQYILVDEFQDSSGTQNQIVSLLTSYWDVPNLFVVGDDDQSIFRFQGAEIKNMADLTHKYADALKTIVLTQNYRSTQPILNVAKQLIDNNKERLIYTQKNLSKNLVAASNKLPTIQPTPVIHAYQTQQAEMVGITEAISALIADGVPPHTIAIIYKENKYGLELANYFNLKKIPFYSKRKINLFDEPLAKKILTVLYYLASELDTPYSGDELLFQILHYNWYTIPTIDIANETIAINKVKYSKDATVIKTLRQAIYAKAQAASGKLWEQHNNLITVSNAIENCLQYAINETLPVTFKHILDAFNILPTVLTSSHRYWELQVVTSISNFIKDETHRNPALTLSSLVSMLHTMQDNDVQLPLHQFNGNDKGVHLLTCHGSKGLEYAHVYVVGINAHIWENKRSKKVGFNIAQFITSDTEEIIDNNNQPINRDLEELRRLFYVAITRAEVHLHLSYYNYTYDGKDKEQSMFVAEVVQQSNIEPIPVTITEALLQEYDVLELSNTARPIIGQLDEEVINRSLDKFVMSSTALSKYLKCPIDFYYNNIVRVPDVQNENLVFGSAIHYAVDKLFTKMMETNTDTQEQKFAPVTVLVQYFEYYMHMNRGGFTKEQYIRRMEYGATILHDYYNKYVHSWHTIVAVERNINNVVISGVPIKGKIDKLEFTGNEVNVVDYKTGKYENAKKQFAKPNDKLPNGGDYWRQAVFYKILVDNYTAKNWKVLSTEFDFVEPYLNKYIKEKVYITPEDIATVTEQIVTVWNKIQAHEFTIGCGSKNCRWCSFVKDNKLAIGYLEADEEEAAHFNTYITDDEA